MKVSEIDNSYFTNALCNLKEQLPKLKEFSKGHIEFSNWNLVKNLLEQIYADFAQFAEINAQVDMNLSLIHEFNNKQRNSIASFRFIVMLRKIPFSLLDRSLFWLKNKIGKKLILKKQLIYTELFFEIKLLCILLESYLKQFDFD